MTVSKELIQDLNIISMNLQLYKENSLESTGSVTQVYCILTRYEKNLLQFSLHENLEKCDFDKIQMHICVQEANGLFNSEKVDLSVKEKGFDWLSATVTGTLPKTIKKLLFTLSVLENQEEKYGRRKEPRLKINKENYLNFGLSSMEQKIFSRREKIIQPCALLDISVHGICIITPFENPAFKKLDNFHIQLSFVNPEQSIILQCHKVHLKLNSTENRIFASISCQLLEPVHYIWKERVGKFMETERINSIPD